MGEGTETSGLRRWKLIIGGLSKRGRCLGPNIFVLEGSRNDGYDQVFHRALKLIQWWTQRRLRHGGHLNVVLLPRDPLPGETEVAAAELVRLKWRYANRRLLNIKNPAVCFVQGYGPEALKKIGAPWD